MFLFISSEHPVNYEYQGWFMSFTALVTCSSTLWMIVYKVWCLLPSSQGFNVGEWGRMLKFITSQKLLLLNFLHSHSKRWTVHSWSISFYFMSQPLSISDCIRVIVEFINLFQHRELSETICCHVGGKDLFVKQSRSVSFLLHMLLPSCCS